MEMNLNGINIGGIFRGLFLIYFNFEVIEFYRFYRTHLVGRIEAGCLAID